MSILESLLQTQLGVFVFSNFVIACCTAVAAVTTVRGAAATPHPARNHAPQVTLSLMSPSSHGKHAAWLCITWAWLSHDARCHMMCCCLDAVTFLQPACRGAASTLTLHVIVHLK